MDTPAVALLTALGTAALGFSDWRYHRQTTWPSLPPRKQRIVAEALRGTIQRAQVWHHSAVSTQRFADEVVAALRQAGAEVQQITGFSAPQHGVQIDHKALLSASLITNTFALVDVKITVRNVYNEPDEFDLRLYIGDTPAP